MSSTIVKSNRPVNCCAAAGRAPNVARAKQHSAAAANGLIALLILVTSWDPGEHWAEPQQNECSRNLLQAQ